MDNVTKRYSKFRFSNGFTEIKNFSRRVLKTYKKPIVVTDKKDTKFIAHRGLSSIWRENSLSAFKAAGKEEYWGIETDVHPTSDGKYVINPGYTWISPDYISNAVNGEPYYTKVQTDLK